MKRALVGMTIFLIAEGVAPVQAAEFYIVRDLTTQKCSVVDKPPTTDIRTITLADDTIYKSRGEAEAGMKSIKVCTGQK